MKRLFVLLSILGVFSLFLVGKILSNRPVLAGNDDKIDWCHCEPNGGCQTLNLPPSALQNAGHMDASGNPLHAGDYSGACAVPSSTPTASPIPSTSPTATPTGSGEPTPTPTLTPEATVVPTTPSCGSDEHLDLSGTKCLKWELGGPPAPPPAGQVLGVSTMAKTGVAEDTLFSLIFILGCLTTAIGVRKIATARV